MLDYYVLHYKVDVQEKSYDDGQPMVTNSYKFNTEEEAIKYANERYREGKTVTVKAVHIVEGWIDIYKEL